MQDVLQLLGAVEDEVLFRLCDMVVGERDRRARSLFLEELSEQGQDLGRLVTDLLEHLRHLLLVQHMNEVPDSLPVTDEARERLREQANQLPRRDRHAADRPARGRGRRHAPGRRPAAAARARARQGDAARPPTCRASRWRFGSSGSRQGTRVAPEQPVERTCAADRLASAAPSPSPRADRACSRVELEQLQEAWRRTILPAVEQRSIPIGKTLAEAHPASLAGDTLTLEFPQTAAFHLKLAEDPKNSAMLRDALYEVTGRKLAVEFELGESGHAGGEDDTPTSEEDVLELMKSTFDARELDE